MSRTRTSPRIRYCIKNLQVLQGWKEGAIAVNGHGRETKPDMTDYRAQFKAAKAQRESAVPGKLSKEQIRALKAKKAAAAAQEVKDAANKREKEGAARAAASSAPPLPKMPPPAPRLAKASKPVPPPPKFGDPVPFRPESQATIITNNGDTPSSDGASKGVGPGMPAVASIEAQSTASTNGAELPSGFFEEAAASAASFPETAASQSGLPSGFFEAPGPSGEDQAEPVGVTAVSEAPLEPESSTAGRLEGSLPGDFFEDAGAGDGEAEAQAEAPTAAVEASASGQPDGSSAIPKGFFANADADAKARGEKPAKPRSKDEQFTDFMASIAADVKEAQVHEEEEAAAEAAERAERELFEQRMRQQRIEELKGGAPSTSTAAAEALGFAEVALDISSIAEGSAPPRKRRRLNVLDVDDDSDDGESEDDELMLDWRAKTV